MKVKIWGARGSIPSPLKPEEVRDKIRYAILNSPDIDRTDPAAVDAYLDQLPPLLSGTAGGNTTCIEIQAGQDTFIIDAGSGLRELGLELMKGPCGRGQGILHFFFSHTHWDHIQGFPYFMPAFIPGNRLYIYSVHDLNLALENQQRPLCFPVPLSYMQATLEFISLQPGEPFSVGEVQLNTIKTAHPGDAYAYRFEDDYGTFVFASDAEYKQLDEASLRPYIEFFKNADLLFFDAQYTLREAWQKIDWGHSSAMIGADIARTAGVKKLVLTHHDPTYSDADLLKIQQQTMEYQQQDPSRPPCEVIVAYEGLTFDLIPPRAVRLRYLPDGAGVILAPTGSFDELGVAELERQVSHLEETGWPSRLVIDLSQTETLTIAGLKALISLRQERLNTAVALASLPRSVQQVIELAGFLDYFAIYPTVEAALAALQAYTTLNLPGYLIKERYRIENKLGNIRHGVVFKATDTHLNRIVAITVLSASFSQMAIDRFLQQARQTISLDHPHIARVLDCDKDQGLAYIVEEFIEARSLHDVLAELAPQPLPADQARDISLSILSALEYVHSRGVVRYNLTSHNVFLADDLKLINFGLGRLEDDYQMLQEFSALLVEALYLAPEQIKGQVPDARTDLYALGVIMYQLFTGRPPFTGTDQEIMEAHLNQAPCPPCEFNPRLSRSLEYLILKLLAKNPAERYATAHQTRQILSGLIVGEEEDPGLSTLLYRHTQPLIERTDELKLMESARAAVQQAGRPRLLVIRSELGMGKSRMVAEFLLRSIVDHDFAAVVGRCDEFGVPYAPYAEILAAIFNKGLVDPQTIGDQAKHLTLQMPGLASILSPYHDVAATRGLTNPQRAQRHFFESVLRVLAKLGPAVLFLEDAAFLDEASVALTRFLIRRGQLPLLIIAAGRVDEEDNPWFKAFQADAKEIITLPPLSASGVETYLKIIMTGTVSEAVVTTVHSRTRGNPYFIEEITHHLTGQGTFYQDDSGQWQYDPDKESGTLPPALLEVFGQRVEKLAESRRIEELTESARQALAVAAVIGPEFDFETWATVLEAELEEGSLEALALDALDEALALRLLRQDRGDKYIFNPVDVADIMAASLAPPRRSALHHQIARILINQQDNPYLIAHHYEQAGLPTRAAHFLEATGAQAMAAHAVNEAIDYYNRAVTLVESQPGYEALGNLYLHKGAAEESIRAFRRALALAEQKESVGDQARILNGLALVLWLYDYYQEAEEAAGTVSNLPNVSEVERASAQSHLGMIAWYSGRLREAEDWCQKSVEILAKTGDEASLAGAYNRLGLAYLARSKLAQARAMFNNSLEIRRRLDDYWGQAYCLNNLGKVATNQKAFDQAQALFASAQQLFEEIDSFDGLMVVHTDQARAVLRQGQANRALPILAKALDQARQLSKPSSYMLGDIHLLLAQANLQLGDLPQARVATGEALKLVETAGNREHIATARAILAQILAAEGDSPGAGKLYQEALTLFEQVGSPAGLLHTRLSYAQFLTRQGKTEESITLKQTARDEANRLGLPL